MSLSTWVAGHVGVNRVYFNGGLLALDFRALLQERPLTLVLVTAWWNRSGSSENFIWFRATTPLVVNFRLLG
jgi:hypothetical protein